MIGMPTYSPDRAVARLYMPVDEFKCLANRRRLIFSLADELSHHSVPGRLIELDVVALGVLEGRHPAPVVL